jgi:hypothetical protein
LPASTSPSSSTKNKAAPKKTNKEENARRLDAQSLEKGSGVFPALRKEVFFDVPKDEEADASYENQDHEGSIDPDIPLVGFKAVREKAEACIAEGGNRMEDRVAHRCREIP